MVRQIRSSVIWRRTCEKILASFSARYCRARPSHLSSHDYESAAIQLGLLHQSRHQFSIGRLDSRNYACWHPSNSLSDSIGRRAHQSRQLPAGIEWQSDHRDDQYRHNSDHGLLSVSRDLHYIGQRGCDLAYPFDFGSSKVSIQSGQWNVRIKYDSHDHAANLDY